MTKGIIETLNYYKARSADLVRSQQLAYIPTIDEDQIDYITRVYTTHGKRVLTHPTDEVCFHLKYIRMRYAKDRKLRRFVDRTTTLSTLVDGNIIYPIMLFINGIFIPYELIKVAICKDGAYLTVSCVAEEDDTAEVTAMRETFLATIRDVKFAQLVTLPDYFQYVSPTRTDLVLEDATFVGFTFTAEGMYDEEDTTYALCTFKHPSIELLRWTTSEGVDGYKMFNDPLRKVTSDNVFLFSNGVFATGNRTNIKRAMDATPEEDDYSHLDIIPDNDELEPNPPVVVESTILTINSGLRDGNEYGIIVFAFTEYTPTADNLAKFAPDGLIPQIRDRNAGRSVEEWFTELSKPFDFEMSFEKDYATNVAEMIKYMMMYDSAIFKDAYLANSNLWIVEKDTDWLKTAVKEDGNLWIPRLHSHMTDEYILMLVNGEIYRYDYFIKYISNFCVIPIQNIEEGSSIEFLRFGNVNNAVYDLTVNADDDYYNFSPDVINDQMVLYSTKPSSTSPYTFPTKEEDDEALHHFPIEYSIETRESDGYMKIVLKDETYYGEPLKIAYKNRFAHYSFIISEDADEWTYRIDLLGKFMYCNDYSRYMVFYNGRRLGQEFYRLVLPVRETTPFTRFYLYITLPVYNGDRVDIVYTPATFQDIVIRPEIERTGNIVLDKSALTYGLNTDLHMIWINGRKVPGSAVKNLDAARLHIATDQPSTKVLCITRFIPDIEELVPLFEENLSTWDKYIMHLDKTEMLNLLAITENNITGDEPSMTEDAMDIKTLMMELIREQYLMSPRVDVTDHFLYDYLDVDDSSYNQRHPNGDYIFNVQDADRQDNLSDVKRIWDDGTIADDGSVIESEDNGNG